MFGSVFPKRGFFVYIAKFSLQYTLSCEFTKSLHDCYGNVLRSYITVNA